MQFSSHFSQVYQQKLKKRLKLFTIFSISFQFSKHLETMAIVMICDCHYVIKLRFAKFYKYFISEQTSGFQMIMVDCCCCCCGVNVCLMRGTEETCASRTIGVSPSNSNGQKRVHSPSPPPPLGLCGCCLVLYCLTKVTLVPTTLRSLQGLLDDQKYLLCTLLYFTLSLEQ